MEPIGASHVRAASRKHRAGLISALFIIALSCVFPVVVSQYIRATLLADQFRMGFPSMEAIDNMKSFRFWIDPMLESELADAKRDNNAYKIMRYSAALMPTHPDIRDSLYLQILPIKKGSERPGFGASYPTEPEPTSLRRSCRNMTQGSQPGCGR